MSIIHELIHNLAGLSDPPENSTETQLNGASFDFKGDVVTMQNVIAGELGFTSNIQASYFATTAPSLSEYSWFNTGASYSNDQHIDIARFGDANANTLDHSARTDNSVDLLFGLGGNDTLKGGGGGDYLYGGGDPSHTGSGKDKLYGGNDGDWLFGGDDNDLLDCGLNTTDDAEENLDGGDGDDILILRGERCVASGGAGDDQYWIADSGDGYTYVLNDTGVGDSIYWHGYLLTGGTKQVIELIYDPDDIGVSYALVGALDSHGFIYAWTGSGLGVFAPEGSGILVEDFENGDFGINIDAPNAEDDVIFHYVETEPSVYEWQYETSLSLSSIADNGQDHDYSSLPGFASTLANDGPNAIPTSWLP